jgi:hypothetical protein
MIDDASRRKDEAFARKLRDWKRRRHGDCKMFFDAFGEPEEMEQNLAARKLVRDFFTDRARARQGLASDPDTDRRPDGV